jgi:two-component system response regulator GlrR
MVGAKARVLVVDDEPSVVLLCKFVLEDAGYQVESATEAEAASALIRSEPFDVFLIDLVMPNRGGLEVIRTAREAAAQTPVVVMTAEPEHVVPRRAGIDYYLHKPFAGLSALEQAIATAMEGRGGDGAGKRAAR